MLRIKFKGGIGEAETKYIIYYVFIRLYIYIYRHKKVFLYKIDF